MKYDTKKTLVENRLHILKEQKTYKKGEYFYVVLNNQTYGYDPKNKSWFSESPNKTIRFIEKYDSSGKFDKSANVLINKLNGILNKSGLIKLPSKDAVTGAEKWKDTEEGKRIISQLSNLGIKLTYEPISMNHAYAMAAIESTKKLTDLISSKISGTNWNKYSICVTKVGGSCSAEYAKFDSFSIQMANTVKGYPENMDGIKPPFFMILQNFYFDYGKIYEDLTRTFKSDKNAYKSDLFPDGWWNWFTTYFGTDNLNNIKTKVSKITYLNLPKVESKIDIKDQKSLWDILNLSDPHSVLDLVSIAVLLLPPPAGIIASSAIDATNALWYLGEGHPYLALFTAIGIGPGIKQTKLLLSSSKIEPKVIKFVEELAYVGKGEKLTQGKVDDIFAKHTKDLTDSEKLKFGQDLININKKVDKKVLVNVYKTASEWEKYSKYDKGLLKNIFKDENNIKLLEKHNGDLNQVLSELRTSLSDDEKRAFCIQAGLYVTISQILPMIVSEELIKEVYKSGLLGFKETVEGNGFDWNETLNLFMVADQKTEPKEYEKDLALLELAWKSGWRPFDIEKVKNGEPEEFILVPKKYRTEKYNTSIDALMGQKKEYRLRGDKKDTKKNTNIEYLDDPIEVDLWNKVESQDSTNTNFF